MAHNHDATTVIHWLDELFSRYGNPDVLVSDNGPEFVRSAFTEFLQQRDIKHQRSFKNKIGKVDKQGFKISS